MLALIVVLVSLSSVAVAMDTTTLLSQRRIDIVWWKRMRISFLFVDMKTLRVAGTKVSRQYENIDGILYVVDTVKKSIPSGLQTISVGNGYQ